MGFLYSKLEYNNVFRTLRTTLITQTQTKEVEFMTKTMFLRALQLCLTTMSRFPVLRMESNNSFAV